VATDDTSKGKALQNPLPVSMSPLTRQRLEALANSEMFGTGARDVARRFIEDGIRNAVKEGWFGEVRLTFANNPSAYATQDEPEPS